MTSTMISLVVLLCTCIGAGLGIGLRRVLPSHHLSDESRDVVKTAAGSLATLVALVLGLLVGSAKSSFDSVETGLKEAGARVIALDRLLARLGPGSADARAILHAELAAGIHRMWPERDGLHSGTGNAADLAAVEAATGTEDLHSRLLSLKPADDTQRAVLAQAAQMSDQIAQSRWLLIEQSQNALPKVFLGILIFWLVALYLTYGLFAPCNVTTLTALLICAVSVSAAVFLIHEMNHPFSGVMKVSSAPLEKALELVGK